MHAFPGESGNLIYMQVAGSLSCIKWQKPQVESALRGVYRVRVTRLKCDVATLFLFFFFFLPRSIVVLAVA